MELSHRELCNPKPYPKTHGYKSCTTSIAGQHNHVEILFALIYLFFVHSEEAQEYVEIGSLNGLFVLGRTVGFIGKRAWSCAVVAGPAATDLIIKPFVPSHKTQLSPLFS